MDSVMIALGWVGIYGAMALAAVGSAIGCARAGAAACGAMLETDSGYGRYVAVSAMPSSQTIYGIVVMFTLNRTVTPSNAMALFAIGVLSGLVQMVSAIKQGDAAAAAIHASKNKPEVFGLAVSPAAIVEGFAVFAFVFALVVSGGIPG